MAMVTLTSVLRNGLRSYWLPLSHLRRWCRTLPKTPVLKLLKPAEHIERVVGVEALDGPS